jgi:hypothetical protein
MQKFLIQVIQDLGFKLGSVIILVYQQIVVKVENDISYNYFDFGGKCGWPSREVLVQVHFISEVFGEKNLS